MKICLFVYLLFMVTLSAQKEAVAEGQITKQTSQAAKEQWLFAEGLFERSWYKEALKEYSTLLERSPSFENAHAARWRLFECHEKLGDATAGFKALDLYIEHEPNLKRRQSARMKKAKLLFLAKKYDEALTIYSSVDKKDDFWESASYEAARIYLKKGKEEKALLCFQELALLKYTGKSAVRAYAIFTVASILSEKRKFTESLKEYKRLTDIQETPAAVVENSWFNVGVIHFQSGDYAQSRKAFEFIITHFSEGRFLENAVNQTARCFIQENKFAEAVQALKLVKKATGEVALERDYLKAYSFWLLKEYDRALLLFDICLSDSSQLYRQDAWFNKLNCLRDAKQFVKVLKVGLDFLKAYPETPHLADAYFTVAGAAESLKKLADAEKYYRLCLKSYTGEWPLIDNVYFALAGVLATSKNYEKEAEVWEELSKRSRSKYRAEAMLKGSEAWMKTNNFPEALKLFLSYLKDFPDGKEGFYVKNRIAEIHIFTKKYDLAEGFLREIINEPKILRKEKTGLQSVLGRVLYYSKKYSLANDVLANCLQDKELDANIKTDCLVYLGFSLISLDKESEGVKALSQAFLAREDFSGLIPKQEEGSIALLFEKYNYNDAAAKVYERLTSSSEKKDQLLGLMGLSRVVSSSSEPEKGLVYLHKVLELCTDENQRERVGALSIMAEILHSQGKEDQALRTFDSALKIKAGDESSICRSLYGMALILKNRKEYDKARRYCNKVFILYRDPVYCPKAMFLAIQISLLASREKDAIQTSIELKEKFPLYFAKIAVQEYLKEHGIKTD